MSTPKTEAKRAKSALVLAKKLDGACKAMKNFMEACVADGDPYPEVDDTRRTLSLSMTEYSGYLERVYKEHEKGGNV